ncbi:MAG: sensor domain-containing diguanylate cyclase [Sulfurovum sp.]|nr:sensor domain-containing diguanylate cyclase [Sulfurovum sp.]
MQKFLFFLFFSFMSIIYADVPLKAVDLSVSNHAIGQCLLEYEDPTANMTISEIRHLPSNAFIPLNKAVASHPFTGSAFWYRFKVENKENRPLSRLIVFEPAWLDSVNITVVSKDGQLQSEQGGNTYPYSKRSIDHYLINFRHLFEPGISTVFVQVKTRDPFIVSISIMKETSFLAEQVHTSLYIGLIYGGIAAMLLYNLFLFFGMKARYYAYYVLFLFAFFVMNASYNGYTFMYLFSNTPTVQNWAQSISIYFFSFTALLFARSFLNLEKYHYTLYIITTYLIYFIVGIAVLSAMFGGYRYHVILAIVFIMLISIYLFVMALYSLLGGNRSARFFLLGAVSGLVGACITALTVMSFIPYTYMTYKASDFGMYIDVILLSMSLADRMKITQEKKIIAEKEAKTDILTGLFNRRAYDKISKMEYKRILRHHRTLSVIMFDVDHFKQVNDTYGHDVGDIVLKSIAAITKGIIRDYDYAFRMGGDEFLLLLPETNEKKALHLAERIRRNIEHQKLEEDNKLFFTASFGIAQYIREDRSIESIARRADMALYQAKKAGRNRVEISASM